MYKRLLVPLDGSQLAESILPIALCLARGLKATVALIHVIEKDAPHEVHGELHLHDAEAAEAYLREIADRWFGNEIEVFTHVHTEEVADVARSILQHLTETDSDLTLMCTHGRSGPREFIYGSIAQQIAGAAVPVLFVRASDGGSESEYRMQRLLVALDGDPEHEQGLRVSAELARICKSPIHLLTIVPNLNEVSGTWTQSVRLEPSTTERMLSMEVDEVREYLQDRRDALEKSGLAVTTEVLRGDPAEEIVRVASETDASLLVLGTHGTTGMTAFWTGSVAAKVARKIMSPVLLIPASSESNAQG